VQRSPYGAVYFRLPAPWRARHLGALHIASSGRATIGAAVGSPWRLRYQLNFRGLQLFATALSLIVVLTALNIGQTVAFWALVGVWVVFYALPYAAATAAFRRLVLRRTATEKSGPAANTGEGSVTDQ
jgi:uncharacterized membrane protein YbhN (UPF0104 family)